MKNFRVQIRAYGYYADFNVKSEDNENAFNDALVDKLGKNDINWEKDGFSNPSKIWITYEEVINANPGQRSLQTEEGSRDRMGNAPA
tara:strand:+ start:90 stop:350 length:261 start_codon:yes stop_codon:yes gene_type:complete